jgi:hypothetical protein
MIGKGLKVVNREPGFFPPWRGGYSLAWGFNPRRAATAWGPGPDRAATDAPFSTWG